MQASELKAARHALGLSANKLAARLGITTRSLRRWEAGTHPTPGPVMVAVAFMLKEHQKAGRQRRQSQ